jgi:hypothetical protein
MRENKQLDPPPAKRIKKSIVQLDAEARSARKTTSKKPPKQVVPPRQIREESSKSVELAGGETPFTSPIETTAMDPNVTMQVPDAVRDLAAKTIDQAEEAFDMCFDAAKKSMASIRSPGTEISKQALSLTEQNMKAAFDHARKLVQATDLQQANIEPDRRISRIRLWDKTSRFRVQRPLQLLNILQIQSEFLKSQFTNAAQHMQQITSEIMSAKDASKSKF